MERSRKLKIITSCLVVVVLFSIPVIYFFKNRQKDVPQSVLGQQDVLGSVPRIISLAPTLAYEGENYVYAIKYTDNDSSIFEISYQLISGPSWLKLVSGEVIGTPPIGSSGTYKFEIRISDGTNSSVQEGYILVQVKDE